MVAAATILISCAGDDGSSVGTSPQTSTTNSTRGSSTVGSMETEEPCSRVHEGDLYVLDDSDLEAFADLGRVAGALQISMKEREQADLSFLGCLHTVDLALSIHRNDHLESTAGMVNLASLKGLEISSNEHLLVVEGFDQVKELGYLEIDQNPELETVDLGALEAVKTLVVGHCEGNSSAANQLALAELDGFDNLVSVDFLFIEGNEALLSAGVLDDLLENGPAKPLQAVQIRRNPQLSEADVLHKLDLLGVQGTVCGNADGAPECFCVVG
jgi:hypothetical protein